MTFRYKCPHCEKIVEGIETPFKSEYQNINGKGRLILIECPECHQKFIRRDEWEYKGTAIAKDEAAVMAMTIEPYVEPEEPKQMVKVVRIKCIDTDDLFEDLDGVEEMVFGNIDEDTIREFIDDNYDCVEIGCYRWSASDIVENMGDLDDFREDDDFKDWVRENRSDNFTSDVTDDMVVGTMFSLAGYDFEIVEVEEEEE